ncbi:hypothetical protein VTN77DRAFT_4667 [Rasamsonia byssochlamydoides]|uniref:uncharacterized protein n=1 Tax=Rasamsonia byssochlamydoides TaxID=89139 RepID=UPI00374390BA
MAAPSTSSLRSMTGKWVVHKGLSDSFDALLALQGVEWWKRQVVNIVTLTEHINHITDSPNDVQRIEIEQRISGGFKGGNECRVLDGSEQRFDNEIFGTIKEWSTWSDLSDVEDEWLKDGWLEGENERAGPKGEKHIKVFSTNEKFGWNVTAIWGFVGINGQRYHARKVVCKKGSEEARARGIYGWVK